MATIGLRDIVKQYANTADEKILRIVKAVFETYDENHNSTVNEPDVFYNLIQKGLQDAELGKIRNHDEVMQDIMNRYDV